MKDTRELMREKLKQTKDKLEDVTCYYSLEDGEEYECALTELPAGALESFLARSHRYTYFQEPSGDIRARRNEDEDNYFSRFSGIVLD
ncbi:hypothetical protein MYX75_09415 [Acidobacteria bacterium AH-259-A15]|nr:hypothetical protein [Acidobacteria bacterium AH-259-A15]